MISDKSLATFRMYDKSADPSAPGGVGKAKKIIAASFMASGRFVVNESLPCLVFLSKIISRPGS